MKQLIFNFVIPFVFGVIGGIVADRLGYSDQLTVEHWIPAAMMAVPYILGRLVGNWNS